MGMSTTKVPEIQNWPYMEMAKSNAEFKKIFGREPSILWIGADLWKDLHDAAPQSEGFFVHSVPVLMDSSDILSKRDFIFGW